MMSDLSESQIGQVWAQNEPGKFFSTRVNLVNRVNPSEQAQYDRVPGQFGPVWAQMIPANPSQQAQNDFSTWSNIYIYCSKT